jgi:hypothetical protein
MQNFKMFRELPYRVLFCMVLKVVCQIMEIIITVRAREETWPRWPLLKNSRPYFLCQG